MTEISAPGKCILTGEHAVIRGFPALALPLRSRQLKLKCSRLQDDGDFEFTATQSDWAGALEACFTKVRETGTAPSGKWLFEVESTIPARGGLGSSAALSVSIARFLEQRGSLKTDVFSFAHSLENIFHGTSSGIDVAACSAEGPIVFRKGAPATAVTAKWAPNLYLFDTGLRAATKDCVRKVQALNNPYLDKRMAEATEIAVAALESEHPEAKHQLAEALTIAASCFADWGLIPPPVREHMERLEALGALAVKPTGSGDGGYLLSLWRAPPPKLEGLLPVF